MTDLQSFIIQLVNQDSPYGITRRGIFYKAVSQDSIPAIMTRICKQLGNVLAGLRKREKLDEDKILDGTRVRKAPYVFSDPGEFLSDIQDEYQKDSREDQRMVP